MRRCHPNPFGQVPVSHQLDVRLNLASALSASGLEPWEIAEMAIHEWFAKNEPGALPMPSLDGFQWKKLFLPNGTVLRTVFGGKNYHCHVEDDQLHYEGKPTSPNGFANLVGGIRRNAWKVIWILFPQTQTWQLAGDLRPPRPARRRAQPGRAAPPASDSPATRPARPEATAASCGQSGQLAPVDDCLDNERRQDGPHRPPGPFAVQGSENRIDTEAAGQCPPVDDPAHVHRGASVGTGTTITLSTARNGMHLTISNGRKDAAASAPKRKPGLFARPARG